MKKISVLLGGVTVTMAGLVALAVCSTMPKGSPEAFERAVKATWDSYGATLLAGDVDGWIAATLGASLALIEPGEVHIELPFSPRLSQQHGYLHAGATTAIADSANGYAALTLAPADAEVLAVEFKINLMAPASAPRFLARGRVLRPGRRLSVCLAEVVALNGYRSGNSSDDALDDQHQTR